VRLAKRWICFHWSMAWGNTAARASPSQAISRALTAPVVGPIQGGRRVHQLAARIGFELQGPAAAAKQRSSPPREALGVARPGTMDSHAPGGRLHTNSVNLARRAASPPAARSWNGQGEAQVRLHRLPPIGRTGPLGEIKHQSERHVGRTHDRRAGRPPRDCKSLAETCSGSSSGPGRPEASSPASTRAPPTPRRSAALSQIQRPPEESIPQLDA